MKIFLPDGSKVHDAPLKWAICTPPEDSEPSVVALFVPADVTEANFLLSFSEILEIQSRIRDYLLTTSADRADQEADDEAND